MKLPHLDPAWKTILRHARSMWCVYFFLFLVVLEPICDTLLSMIAGSGLPPAVRLGFSILDSLVALGAVYGRLIPQKQISGAQNG
ncbi:hypothetical protein [Rhizobium leguminosarum]|uniref:hypothetical protein n=1 Tax=Rhizobium leguminosarum TaxID=384 RepID=UPI003F99AAEA